MLFGPTRPRQPLEVLLEIAIDDDRDKAGSALSRELCTILEGTAIGGIVGQRVGEDEGLFRRRLRQMFENALADRNER